MSKAELVDAPFDRIQHRRSIVLSSKGELIDGLQKLVSSEKISLTTSSYWKTKIWPTGTPSRTKLGIDQKSLHLGLGGVLMKSELLLAVSEILKVVQANPMLLVVVVAVASLLVAAWALKVVHAVVTKK